MVKPLACASDSGPVVFLLVLGLILHLLWLDLPREVIFDEVHFGKFINSYCCNGERFFDIHPPHAKLWLAAGTKLFGYDGGMSFAKIGLPYQGVSPIAFRIWPALWGAILPVMVYWLTRELGGSRATGWLAGILMVLDNALLVQTRLMALDGLMLVGIFGGVAAWLRGERGLLERDGFKAENVKWLVLSGVLLGLAAGTKFTGLAGLVLVGLIALARIMSAVNWKSAGRGMKAGVIVLVVAMVIYGAGWLAHWWLLDQAGPGDAWGVPSWNGSVVGDLWWETVRAHKTMLGANYNLSAEHPYSSRWHEWPVMKRPVFYWAAKGSVDRAGGIYFLGNPVVWWGGGMLFIVALLTSAVGWLRDSRGHFSSFVSTRTKAQSSNKTQNTKHKCTKSESDKLKNSSDIKLWIPLAGYLISLGPLMRVPRALFLYHYLTPLIFGLIFGVLWLEQKGLISNQKIERQAPWYWIVIGSAAGMFLYFAPLTYGWLVPTGWYESLFWLESWR